MEESIQQVEKELEDYFVKLFQQLNKDDSDSTQPQLSSKLNLDEITDHIQHILTSRCKLTANQLEYTLEKSRIMLAKNFQQALIKNRYRCEKHTASGGNVSPTKRGSKSPFKESKKNKK